MITRTPILALLAVLGVTACNVDNDADGIAAQFDCDDTNADIYPDAPEKCDGLDNDCDNIVDEDTIDAPTFYQDFDRDGFGDPDATTTDCKFLESAGGPDPDHEPFGFVKDDQDCDDALASVNPDADERCDGIDNDCDGEVDEDDAIDTATWYADSDDDEYGDAETTTQACDQPTGFVADDTDCDDDKDTVNPGEDEVCDDDDNDCDGEVDEDDAVDAPSWYRDADDDRYGDATDRVFSCSKPVGYVDDDTDCDDTADTAYPGGTEICDGLDNDCDSRTSEAGTVSINATTAYSSIQAAVDAAAEGATVWVCAGTWLEDIYSITPITLKGATGADDVIIEGSGSGPVLELRPDSSATYRIEGLTIRGGNSSDYGGGISAYATSAVEVADCVVEDNSAIAGGGIAGSLSGTTTITDTTVEGNVAVDTGGGIYMTDGEVLDSRVIDNEARFAGGIAVYDGAGTVSLDGTKMISNYASFGGGGLVVWPGATADGGEVLNNLADGNGGGAYIGGNIANLTLSGNRAGDQGGGVYVESFSSELDGVVIDGNLAREGGGVAGRNGFSLIDVEVTNNEATSSGGGGWHRTGGVTLDTCVIEGNVAPIGGGWHLAGSTLESIASDWGTGTEDNDPDDIYADASGTAYTTFGAGASFTCDTSGDCS
jgi:hypothetical protein